MTSIVLYGDTYDSAHLRHVVPLGIPDPLLYVDHGGERHVVCDAMEVTRVAELDGLAAHAFDEFEPVGGRVRADRGRERLEQAVSALAAFGVRDAIVPRTFPVELADLLRSNGMTVDVQEERFAAGRRSKNTHELVGITRAQRAAEAGLAAGLALLERSVPEGANGELVVDGEVVTVERVKREIAIAVARNGAGCIDMIVSHGTQTAIGHDMGAGPIRAGEPVIIDLWPRDTESGCHADLTRTVVVGAPPPQIAEWHAVVRAALAHVVERVGPGVGVADVYGGVCGFIEAAGYASPRSGGVGPGRPGCRGLGHGVGLDVHEPPVFGLKSESCLQIGDVLAVEPGLYDPSIGGVRIEDLVLVTESGCDVLTTCPYDLALDAAERARGH